MTNKENLNDTPPMIRIAFILDGFVQEVIECSEKFAAILLSRPIARNITGLDIPVGFQYDVATDTFADFDGESLEENRK
jgi:hypothetical protein